MENWWFNTEFKVSFKRTVSPCFNCKDRHAGCHAECERYAEWKKADLHNANMRLEEKIRQDRPVQKELMTAKQQNRWKEVGRKK